ncbi:putative SP-containing protein [Vairimorpha necatrix]|uniref:SP-containing protein n=1 Tax=Vairimorpha necatrix TaxID=6039 RepID=A0AAX4JEU0_9MICR
MIFYILNLCFIECFDILFIARKNANESEIYISMFDNIYDCKYSTIIISEMEEDHTINGIIKKYDNKTELEIGNNPYVFEELTFEDKQNFENNLKNFSSNDVEVIYLAHVLNKSKTTLRTTLQIDLRKKYHVSLIKISKNLNLEYYKTSDRLIFSPERMIYKINLNDTDIYHFTDFAENIPSEY